jgi:hypothetical protein
VLGGDGERGRDPVVVGRRGGISLGSDPLAIHKPSARVRLASARRRASKPSARYRRFPSCKKLSENTISGPGLRLENLGSRHRSDCLSVCADASWVTDG